MRPAYESRNAADFMALMREHPKRPFELRIRACCKNMLCYNITYSTESPLMRAEPDPPAKTSLILTRIAHDIRAGIAPNTARQ